MPTLSPAREQVPLLEGLTLFHRGKVRDTYDLGDDRLLVVATDGISIFDFVLNAIVPQKGMVLTAMNHFWLRRLESAGVETHLIAAGASIDQHLPEAYRGNSELQARALVVRKLDMIPVEFIARGYLTGSAFTEYMKAGKVCGHELKQGLQDGDDLSEPIDTPTTKAMEGKD